MSQWRVLEQQTRGGVSTYVVQKRQRLMPWMWETRITYGPEWGAAPIPRDAAWNYVQRHIEREVTGVRVDAKWNTEI